MKYFGGCDVGSTYTKAIILDENGKLCLDKANLTAFAHGEYFALGDVVGKFGFSVAKTGKGTKPSAQRPAQKARGGKKKA